jgi:nitrate reductase assembly molybdenum cofactor insertion protein NarJ
LLLVKMRQQLRAHGIRETTELPDHLTNALRLLPRMEREAGAYFAEAIVLPALEKMLQAIRGKENPYEHVLEAARLAIRADFPDLPVRLAVPAGVPELRVLA